MQYSNAITYEHLFLTLVASNFFDFSANAFATEKFIKTSVLYNNEKHVLKEVCECIAHLTAKSIYDGKKIRILGIPSAGTCIATPIILTEDISLRSIFAGFYPLRQVPKTIKVSHEGTDDVSKIQRYIIGECNKDEKVILLDDLLSQGKSKLKNLMISRNEGFDVSDIIVIVDLEQGSKYLLKDCGCKIHSLFSMEQIAYKLLRMDLILHYQKDRMLIYMEKKVKEAKELAKIMPE